MLFLYREQDIRFFGLCHDPGSDDAFPNLGKSNFDSGIDIGPCLVFYSSSSVSYHEKKARVVKIPAYRVPKPRNKAQRSVTHLSHKHHQIGIRSLNLA
jgi:hypothetical protein